jgi:hypothetical protein
METVTEKWTEFTIGIVLLISPWVLGFSAISIAKWCNVLFGIVLVVMSAWKIFGTPPAMEEPQKTESPKKSRVKK